jgi:ketosteroid isomerase-like protein
MKHAGLLPLVALLCVAPASAEETAPEAAPLTGLLKEFLAGASRNDAATHARFWAEDLVYTGSSGKRRGKAEILADVRSAPAAKPGAPTTVYTAEDIRIRQYGDAAVVAFRLVGTTQAAGKVEIAHYLNTGTFLKRNGKWQAVAWQATRMARPEEEAKREVTAAQAALHRAMLGGDVKTLESLLDDGFIWTRRFGEKLARQALLDQMGSGSLRYSKLETRDVTVDLYGDTAVVRGASERQRSSFPGSGGGGDLAPFTAFYTLTFVNQGSGWKAVAMHSGRAQGQ